jgi:hypothetical protein
MNNDKKIKNIIDSRLSEITVNDELKYKILNKTLSTKKSNRRPLAAAAVICLCVMFSVPIMAYNIPKFNRLLSIVSDQTAQLLQPIEMVCEDNGIKMEVLAAMNDDETAIVYLTLQDLVGNRVDNTIDLYNYSINGANTFTHELVHYDEQTNTATIRLLASGGKKMNGKKVTVRVDSFLSGKETFKIVTPNNILSDIVLKTAETTPLDMNHIPGGGGNLYNELKAKRNINVLKQDQTNISLPNIDFVHISNIGYVDGRLHIQTKWEKSVDNHGYFYLTNNTNEQIQASSINFGFDEKGNTTYGSENKNGCISAVHQYQEYIFDIEVTQISKYTLGGYFVKNNNYTEGNWQTTFKIEAVDKAKKTASNFTIGNIKIDSLSITPLGINITGNSNALAALDIQVSMKDGTTVHYTTTHSYEEDKKSSIKYLTYTPIKIEDIKEVKINGSDIDFK